MAEENIFKESKSSLAQKMYELMEDELCDMAEVCDIGEFEEFFQRVLEDYALVHKGTLID